jgi:hypothetical protein
MTQERVIQYLVTDRHYWLIEAMADGKVWFTIGETKYLFSLREIVNLCLGLLQLAVKSSNILDPMPETGEKPIGGPAIDELDQFREDAA